MESTPRDIPRRLPRGAHGLDPGVVAASQRTRLLEAVGRAVAEKGYAAATIDDIVRGAGVSKKTFYDHFSDKLDCFLAAYEAASDELLARLREAQSSPEGWLERTRAGIVAYLRWLAAEPALARPIRQRATVERWLPTRARELNFGEISAAAIVDQGIDDVLAVAAGVAGGLRFRLFGSRGSSMRGDVPAASSTSRRR